ncbi:ArsR/SmtB family transcription factor [Martelella endophytica]|uniref:HTH arsR-type domain-containing protein n=1 Tax=Martelella endophytica TaxID=1486262 RepID=A0A0D5LQ08_MAREN|nr:helix-turn-helix transcriptional regulator [Martelella endophytica]AJY45403.1 hypothetical protein TM49_06360 [Martelella endophytica]
MTISKVTHGCGVAADAARLAYISDMLAALASGHCLVVAAALAARPQTVQQLRLSTGLSLMLIAASLARLTGAGIVAVRRDGDGLTYALSDERFADVIALAEHLHEDVSLCVVF